MGHWVSTHFTDPTGMPDYTNHPKFDASYGFGSERKERVMVATEAEMSSTRLKLEYRDYCAHKLIDYNYCKYKNWPLPYKCKKEKHEYLDCEYQDFTLRAMEYEREKRLIQRERRKKLREEKERSLELTG